jgi:hypothetical protein
MSGICSAWGCEEPHGGHRLRLCPYHVGEIGGYVADLFAAFHGGAGRLETRLGEWARTPEGRRNAGASRGGETTLARYGKEHYRLRMRR